jgi:hypothetical protein
VKIDKRKKEELLKKFPKEVVLKALKKAKNDKDLNEYLEMFLDSFYKTVMENANPYPENLYNSSGRKCFM